MVAQAPTNDGEDDMEPSADNSVPAMGDDEPDDSPIPKDGDGNLGRGRGLSNANEVLNQLGAGSPYKSKP